MNPHTSFSAFQKAGLAALSLLLACAACRKEHAPALSPAAPSKVTSPPAPAAVATKPDAAKSASKSMNPSSAPTPAPEPRPSPKPAIVSVPVDGPDIFLRDRRPPVDYAQVFRDEREAAMRGSARSQAKLGRMIWNAHGTGRDPTTAVDWLRKAAEQGDAEGQYYLGHAYEQGFGVARDEAEAVKWKRKALEQGFQPTLPSGGSELSKSKQ